MMVRTLRNNGRRPAFTIAELLVAMMIIAIIASALLVAVAGARESARKARTQAIVANIQELIMHRWDSYLSRPMPPAPSNIPPNARRRHRLDSVRELMRMEMPERKTDVTDNPRVLRAPPSLSLQYRRRASGNWTDEHQQAECLYMILASMQDDSSSALDSFGSSDIGNVDGDDVPEMLDAFGNPIAWLRWTPGWRSPVQLQHDPQQGSQDPKFSPDGIDLGKADTRWSNNDPLDDPYAMFPLIVSAGPDESYGIADLDSPSGIQYSTTPTRPNDPYAFPQIGVKSSGWEDNIDNHYSINE